MSIPDVPGDLILPEAQDSYHQEMNQALQDWANTVRSSFTDSGVTDAGDFTTITASGNVAFNGDTTIGDASGDALTINPAAWTLANAVTIAGSFTDLGTVTTVDINGGTADDLVIGGSSSAAVTGTTLKADTSLELAAGATVTEIEDNDSLGTSDTKLCTQGNTKAYSDAITTAMTIPTIEDYGTSSSSSTSKNQSALKICYGEKSIAQDTTNTFTNLPFTSAASYSVAIGQKFAANDDPLRMYPSKSSGSSFTIKNTNSGKTIVVYWIAIGT